MHKGFSLYAKGFSLDGNILEPLGGNHVWMKRHSSFPKSGLLYNDSKEQSIHLKRVRLEQETLRVSALQGSAIIHRRVANPEN